MIKNIKHIGDEVFNLISWFDFEKVRNAKVLVVGAGALGNEALKNLALLGVGNIVIVDFDRVERANLCRSVLFRNEDAELNKFKCEIAAARVKELNPDINIHWINGDIQKEVGLGHFHDADVVLGCLDNRLARYVVNDYSFRFRKSWVDAGIQNLEGNASVYEFGKSCYACSLSELEKANLAYRLGCPDIVQFSYNLGRIATTPISASIFGAIQVQEALKIIHGFNDGQLFDDYEVCRTLSGRLLKYEGMNLDIFTPPFVHYSPDCTHHETWDKIIRIPELSNKVSAADFFKILELTITDTIEGFYTRNAFVPAIVIEPRKQKIETMLPESKIEEFALKNSLFPGEGEKIVKLPSPEGGYRFINQSFEWKHLPLENLGIPAYDIVKVIGAESDYYVELSGDSPFEKQQIA